MFELVSGWKPPHPLHYESVSEKPERLRLKDRNHRERKRERERERESVKNITWSKSR